MKILLLHAYSADNIGDGFLVDAALEAIESAWGPGAAITLVAQYPRTFRSLPKNVQLVAASRNPLATYRRIKSQGPFDTVVGVGGGYLRLNDLTSLLKTGLIHGPQLLYASRHNSSVYLPQSIGPLTLDPLGQFRSLLSKLQTINLRDERSVAELRTTNCKRMPDMAVLSISKNSSERLLRPLAVDQVPVLSVRTPPNQNMSRLRDLSKSLGCFDGFIQSETGNNRDTQAMTALAPRRLLNRSEMHGNEGPTRVVVAVRLHAALLAIAAGHFVIHLAYERKGFGAFEDLGLTDYCHNVNSFSPDLVLKQIHQLVADSSLREAYRSQIDTRQSLLDLKYKSLIQSLRADPSE